jgi:hypothetical protein
MAYGGKEPTEYQETGMADVNEPEPLNAQSMSKADSLLPHLGEDIVRRLFSKTWQFRDDGIRKVELEVKGGRLF